MAQRHPTVHATTSPHNSPSPDLSDPILASRQKVAVHAAEIRAKRSEPGFKALPPSEDRPMSKYPDILEKLDMPTPSPPMPSPRPQTALPTYSQTLTHHPSLPLLTVPSGPQVRDPVDVAVERLVGMGFEERRAKKALADTDSGNSVDFERAVEVLVRERKREVAGLMFMPAAALD
jgi:hypothetical protein